MHISSFFWFLQSISLGDFRFLLIVAVGGIYLGCLAGGKREGGEKKVPVGGFASTIYIITRKDCLCVVVSASLFSFPSFLSPSLSLARTVYPYSDR